MRTLHGGVTPSPHSPTSRAALPQHALLPGASRPWHLAPPQVPHALGQQMLPLSSCSEKGVRLAQKMQVGPRIPVGMQI